MTSRIDSIDYVDSLKGQLSGVELSSSKLSDAALQVVGYDQFNENVELLTSQRLLGSTKCCGSGTC